MKKHRSHFVCIPIFIFIAACSGNKQEPGTPNVSGKDLTKETFSISTLLPESKVVPDSMIMALNAQHHQLKVLERRTVPHAFKMAALKWLTCS